RSEESVGEGSVYDILLARAGLRAEVPVGSGEGSSGVVGKTSPSGKKPTSGAAWLAREDYGQAKKDLGTWLTRHGIRSIRNGGGGRNNCLVISLLQHATESPAEPSSFTVNRFKAELGVGENEALLPTDVAFTTLLTAINKEYTKNMKVVYVQAF